MKYILADTEVLYDKNSPKDKMVTVYVPYDCENDCKFCISKSLYKLGTNKEEIINWLKRFRDSDITEVIFTGGNPDSNVKLLKEMIEIVSNKNIFINTTFLENTKEDFINLVNSYDCIKGVNISRHFTTFEDDIKITANIAPDFDLKKINTNVRINVVIDDNFKTESIPEYIERWSKLKKDNLDITFRTDYNKINKNNLYDLDNPIVDFLTENYEYDGQLYCHACSKTFFKDEKFGGIIRYHRGLQNTRIKIGKLCELQELVLFPDGKLHSDWDGTDDGLDEYLKILKV